MGAGAGVEAVDAGRDGQRTMLGRGRTATGARMRYGSLDRVVSILRKSMEQSTSGEITDAFSIYLRRRSAQYRALQGDERFSEPQIVAGEQVEFTLRYSRQVSRITPLDVLIYPGLKASE